MIYTKRTIKLNVTDMAVLNAEPFHARHSLAELFSTNHIGYPPILSGPILTLLAHRPYSVGAFWKYYRQLLDCTNHSENHYREILYQTKTKKRILYQADPYLRYYQNWVHKHLLDRIEYPNCATAYRRGRSVLDNASPHCGKQMLIKLDISNFFNSITEQMVYYVFRDNLPYPSSVLTILTKLCCHKGRLPQGATTSPTVSNLVMRDFDLWISDYCKVRDLTYTRYSDDMTFSGNDIAVADLIRVVRERLHSMGFALNNAKIKVLGKGSCHRVTGVVCNEKLSVPVAYRKKIRQEMHYMLQYGVEDHLKKMGDTRFIGKDGELLTEYYLRNLLGRVNYVLLITPTNTEFKKYKTAIENIGLF